MRLKRLSIQRQPDDTFAIVAKVEYINGSIADVVLNSGATKPSDLQKAFTVLVNDEDTLQVEILANLQQTS